MIRAIVLGLASTLVLGGTARAGPAEDLIEALREGCRPGRLPPGVEYPRPHSYGLIGAADVRSALNEVYPVGSTILTSRPVDPKDDRSNALWLADRAYAPQPASSEEQQLARVGALVSEWSRPPGELTAIPLGSGGLRILAAEPLEARQVLARIFAGDDNGLTIVCRYPAPAPAETSPPAGPAFLLTKTPEGLDKAKLKDRAFAEFSYLDDRQARTQAWGVQLAASLDFSELRAVDRDAYVLVTPRLYLAYERKGENDPDSDGYANNLEFGARVAGKLGLGSDWLGYFSASGAYQTDDDFDSAAYAAEARLDPPLPYIPYHRVWKDIGSRQTLKAEARWTAELVADWVKVGDPGEKAAWADKAEYVRLGYDAGLQMLVGPARKDWAVGLEATYSVRDGQTADGGDAQLFTSTLSYVASEDANWAFGLSYERGENLTSFESSELWKLVLGLRF